LGEANICYFANLPQTVAMKIKDIHIPIEIYATSAELPAADAALLQQARDTTQSAYAPYSKFLVGAVAMLANGSVVIGTNQENASYPAGLCAERVLLSAAATLHPGIAVNTMAISYNNLNGESNQPISPCGICRQSLAEYEERTKQPIRIILSGIKGEVYIIKESNQLLPLTFMSGDLKK
jgi:cytidine deaminase